MLDSFIAIFASHKIKLIFKLLISCLFISIIFYKIDFGSISKILLETDFTILISAFLIQCVSNLFGAFRLKKLLSFKNYSLPVSPLLRHYFISFFFNFFSPSIIGGEMARGYFLYNQGVKKKTIVSSLLFERFMGISVLILLSSFSIFLSEHIYNESKWLIIIIFIFYSVLCYFIFYYNHGSFFNNLLMEGRMKFISITISNIREFKNAGIILKTFSLSFLMQLSGIVSIYLIGISLNCMFGFITFLMLLPPIWLVSMIPVSINGLGIREGSFVFLFMAAGMSKEMALSISILSLLQIIIQAVIGGLLFIIGERKILKNKTTTL